MCTERLGEDGSSVSKMVALRLLSGIVLTNRGLSGD